jgi:PAP2 superfamily
MTLQMSIFSGVCRKLAVAASVLLISLGSVPAKASADVVLDWNAIAARTVTAGQNPFSQARLMAITQLAVFEAVNAVTGEYEPYLSVPVTATSDTSADAAAIAAAYKVLKNYFPLNTAIDTDRANALAAIPDGFAKTNGIAVGEAAAAAMIVLRERDGSAPPTFFVPSSTLAGDWQTTPSCPSTGGQFYQWQDVTPFGIGRVSDFLLPAPPALTSNHYAKDYVEVQTVGAANSPARPADRTAVARLYAASSPSFALSMVARQIAAAKGLSSTGNARALALIMMGINDSLIASFYNKYHYNLWRPETAIRAGALDGNDKTDGDSTFAPFITTPCFPSYPSNHASGTNGGLEMMRRLFGAAGHDMTFTNTVPALGTLPAATVSRHYTQLKQIAADVDDARVYGGIHYRFDQVAGNVLGRAVATEIYKNHLRPRHGPQ